MLSSALVRMRIILFALASVLLYAQTLIVRFVRLSAVHNSDGTTTDLRPVVHGADAVLFLAAVTIFVFSFVKIKRDGGELCYDPSNPYWQLMKWAFGNSWTERISLCKSYWLTVFLIGAPTAFVSLVTVFAVFVVPDVIREIIKNPKQAGLAALCCIGGCVVIGAVSYCVGKLAEKWKPMRYILAVLGIAFAVGIVVGMPIWSIHSERQVSYGMASGIYAEWSTGIIGSVAIVALLAYLAFKYLPALKDSWLGHLLAAFKDKMCPTLVACHCEKQEQAS